MMSPDSPVPASTTPVQDYLDRSAPGATPDHLVVPRSLAQSMPLRWQQVFVGLLADLHDAYGHLPWPEYKVVPSRWELLIDLDDEQLTPRATTPTSGRRGSSSTATPTRTWWTTRSATGCSPRWTTRCPRLGGPRRAPPRSATLESIRSRPVSARVGTS